jgi:hypothetical protein
MERRSLLTKKAREENSEDENSISSMDSDKMMRLD